VAEERSRLGANTVLHNAIIVAQFLKRQGPSGITREVQLPERITSLPIVYQEDDLAQFFAACYDEERALLSIFLLTCFREQEVMYLLWTDINVALRTVRVTAKPETRVLSEALGRARDSWHRAAHCRVAKPQPASQLQLCFPVSGG